MNAVRVQKKASECSYILTENIAHQVALYYRYVEEQFALLDLSGRGSSKLVLSEVQTCYQSLKAAGVRQPEAYQRIVEWIMEGTGVHDRTACEILTSFFVQNCEVYDAPAK